jgi:hypothetical protein
VSDPAIYLLPGPIQDSNFATLVADASRDASADELHISHLCLDISPSQQYKSASLYQPPLAFVEFVPHLDPDDGI